MASEYHDIPKPPEDKDPWTQDYYDFVDQVDDRLELRGSLADRPASAPDGARYFVDAGTDKVGAVFVYDANASTWDETARRATQIDVVEPVVRIYENGGDETYIERHIDDLGTDLLAILQQLKTEYGTDLNRVQLPAYSFDADPATHGTITWDISADIYGISGGRSASRGGGAATGIALMSSWTDGLITVDGADDVTIRDLYFSGNKEGPKGYVLEFDQGDFSTVRHVGMSNTGGGCIRIHNGSHRVEIRHFYNRRAGDNGNADSDHQSAILVERSTNNVRQTLIDHIISTNNAKHSVELDGCGPITLRNVFGISNDQAALGLYGVGACSIDSAKLEGNAKSLNGASDPEAAEVLISDQDFGGPGQISLRDCHMNGADICVSVTADRLNGLTVDGCTFAGAPAKTFSEQNLYIDPAVTTISDSAALHIAHNKQGYSGEVLCQTRMDRLENRHDLGDLAPALLDLGGGSQAITPPFQFRDPDTYRVDAGGSASSILGIDNIAREGFEVTLLHDGAEDVTLAHNDGSASNPLLNQSGGDDTLTANNQFARYLYRDGAWRQTALVKV